MMDLHTHSKYSFDGEMSLEEIVQVSKELGVKILSLTDHDNIYGLKKFIEIANKENIIAIPGVE
ncbi:MAG: PHP domain-containing protein [Vulcanibacillus sp.]